MALMRFVLFTTWIVLSFAIVSSANELAFSVCSMVSPRQLAALYSTALAPRRQANGCRWSDAPDGTAIFQIGLIQSSKNLRQFFEKQIPVNYRLRKTDDLGDRGLYTESRGYLSVIAIREGSWVLISTVDLLYIKQGDERQTVLWDIYRKILQRLD